MLAERETENLHKSHL